MNLIVPLKPAQIEFVLVLAVTAFRCILHIEPPHSPLWEIAGRITGLISIAQIVCILYTIANTKLADDGDTRESYRARGYIILGFAIQEIRRWVSTSVSGNTILLILMWMWLGWYACTGFDEWDAPRTVDYDPPVSPVQASPQTPQQ